MSPGSGPATQIGITGAGEPARLLPGCPIASHVQFGDQEGSKTGDRSQGGARVAVQLSPIAQRTGRLSQPEDQPGSGLPGSPRRCLLSPGLPAAACCALGLSPGGLPGRLVTVGAGTLRLSLGVIRASRLGRVLPGLAGPGLGPGRPGLRVGHHIVRLLPRRSQLLSRGPRLLLGGG
jgi:hypothetical protein